MAQKKKGKAKAPRGGQRGAVRAGKKVKAHQSPGKVSRPAARKTAKRTTAKKRVRKAPAAPPARKPRAAAGGGKMLGESVWKADAKYRESLRKFARTHDVEALARQAALDLEPDVRDSEDEDVAGSARRGAEEEPEW